MMRQSARAVALLAVLVAVGAYAASSRSNDGAAPSKLYGAFGPEGPRMREQFWIMPSGDSRVALRATVFQPDTVARHPLVVINHGTDERTRQSVSMPVFYWLSRWFVERGYAVAVPQRRGHGATGGELVEAFDSCLEPNHLRAGEIAADDIEAVVKFMRTQSFVDPSNIVVVGISSGGWASLALAARNPEGVRRVINFAGGRGAYAGGKVGAICAADRLVDAAGRFGAQAHIPTLWLYSTNDSYFGADVAQDMAHAWTTSGGHADFRLLPPYGSDGHNLADDRAGWNLWGNAVSDFLADDVPHPSRSESASLVAN